MNPLSGLEREQIIICHANCPDGFFAPTWFRKNIEYFPSTINRPEREDCLHPRPGQEEVLRFNPDHPVVDLDNFKLMT
jgi:hypothetical protein